MNTQMMHERQQDEDSAENLRDAIDARSKELLNPGESCDPLDGHSVIEAMEAATDIDKTILGRWLANGTYDACGMWMTMISHEYWAKRANEMAEEELA